MNKKRIFVLLACLSIVITSVILCKSEKNNEITDCVTFSSHEKFNYNELVNAADVIALVEVKDKLTKENSTIEYVDGTRNILYHYSTRELEVLEYYKNTLNQGNILKVIEETAITKNNEYLHDEGYQALEKGQKYIVYLSKDNGLDSLSIISTNNGKVKLAEFDKNEFTEIAVKSIMKAENINFEKSSEFKQSNNLKIDETGSLKSETGTGLEKYGIDVKVAYYSDEVQVSVDGKDINFKSSELYEK